MSIEPQAPPQRPQDVGIQTRIRAALSHIADEVASKSRVVIAVPGKEISEAMYEIFDSVPRIPDYNPDAVDRRYSTVVEYASDEIPPDPIDLHVQADVGDEERPHVTIRVSDGEHTTELPLDPSTAEEFFLAGLAAVAYARATPR